MTDGYLRLFEASRRYKVSADTLKNWAEQKRLSLYRSGRYGHYSVKVAEVERVLDERAAAPDSMGQLACWSCAMPTAGVSYWRTTYGEMQIWKCSDCGEMNFAIDGVQHRAIFFERSIERGLMFFKADTDGRTVAHGGGR